MAELGKGESFISCKRQGKYIFSWSLPSQAPHCFPHEVWNQTGEESNRSALHAPCSVAVVVMRQTLKSCLMVCSVKSPSSQSLKFVIELIPTEKDLSLICCLKYLTWRSEQVWRGWVELTLQLTWLSFSSPCFQLECANQVLTTCVSQIFEVCLSVFSLDPSEKSEYLGSLIQGMPELQRHSCKHTYTFLKETRAWSTGCSDQYWCAGNYCKCFHG